MPRRRVLDLEDDVKGGHSVQASRSYNAIQAAYLINQRADDTLLC
jgi:hypothetical protein